MQIERLDNNPIITPAMSENLSNNINGPSLIKAPNWIENSLGKYYLYFADHRGDSIHLAYADHLAGPWKIHSSGTLTLENAGPGFDDHIASPDVHVDEDREQIQMYFHGAAHSYMENFPGSLPQRIVRNGASIVKSILIDYDPRITYQFTRVALSEDGLNFRARPEPLGRFYFRVFQYRGHHYALAKFNQGSGQDQSGQRVYRSSDGLSQFTPGPVLFNDGARHTAVCRQGDTLDVFYSRIGDAPERILHATIDLTDHWKNWTASDPGTILAPKFDWEGASHPVEKSAAGAVDTPVKQLRDPAIFVGRTCTYLLYSVAGESGIGIARMERD